MNLIKWLSVLVLFIALLSLACGDDDDSSDDDSVDDDTDDDDSVDDDTTDDDSTDDDDDDDDDTSPDDDTGDDDGEATELLVIGEDGNGAGFSLRRQSDGWLRENFPAQGIANSFLGPSFFLAGRTGWQAINVAYSLTLDYRLLVYDPQNGWSLDAAHLPQQDSFNVSALFAPEADNLWAATASFTFGNFIFALLSYVDGEPTAIAPATNGYMFMDFTRPDNGYFIGTYWMEAAIVGYWNGQTMSRLEVPAGKYVLLQVRDDGCGMPPEVLERIFEPFFTTKPIGQGTGLGLYVSYGIALKHGGNLTAANNEQGGATFTLEVPINERT